MEKLTLRQSIREELRKHRSINQNLLTLDEERALLDGLAEVIKEYAPTESGAPLSDEEWKTLVRWSFPSKHPDNTCVTRLQLDTILAKRNTAQSIPPQSQQDAETCALWRKVQDGHSVKQPTPPYMNTPNAFVGERPGKSWKDAQPEPIASTAQDDWNDQHGHRSEILPLIGGEPVKKENAAPVDGDLSEKARKAFLSAPDNSWDTAFGVIQRDRDARWEKAIVEECEHRSYMVGIGQKLVNDTRARIEAKPQTLEERIHAILIGSDSVTDKFNAVMALIPKPAKEQR